jgi:signal transduction histidine kinase
MSELHATDGGNPLQHEVELLRQQLSEAQKYTALGELVSTTTHEFNNVLMTIINYAKLGLRHQDAETRDKAFGKILAAGERAARITNSVLGIARNRSEEREPTDLTQLIHESLVLLEREMSKYRVRVVLELNPVPRAMVRGNQIQQVLLNLLINARQAMPNGGDLIIRLTHDKKSQTVDLQVRDQGCGISQDKLPHIFERGFTTKSGPDATGRGGSGLGLAACKDIIASHGGKVRVESSVGKGTMFTVKLPAEIPAQTAPVAAVTQLADSSPASV